MAGMLADVVSGWDPAETRETDHLDAARAARLADILDAGPAIADDGILPPTWQWAYFAEWPPEASLNADGHPADGPFQPPIPGRRRMWAGGALTVLRPIRLEKAIERRGSLLDATPKSGRTGEMVIVRVQYDYLQDGEVCHREVQNHVYRSGDAAAPAPVWPARPTEPVRTDAPWRHDIATDPVRLFRMSALTGNSHRIHYDRPYATEVEGYPDLVVHGPLLAQQMALLGERHQQRRRLRQLDYRLEKPVFVGDLVSAIGRPNGEDADLVELAVLSAGDRLHARATARYEDAR